MGYYDFPHSRNYDKDLGFLIERYNKLIEEVNMLETHISQILSDALVNGEIFVDTIYNPLTKTLKFVFKKVEVNNHE